MAIDLHCNGCQQLLRVADEHAGKKARCPKCGTINSVPGTSDAAAGSAPLSGSSSDWGSSPSALPPERETSPDYNSTSPFSSPSPPKPSPFDAQNPFSDAAAANPYASPQASTTLPHGATYAQPHRGGMILTFGILGLLCCGFFGIAAWAMGATDLAAMKRGRMDPSGQALTMVGMILGIVSTALMVLGILLQMAMVAIG